MKNLLIRYLFIVPIMLSLFSCDKSNSIDNVHFHGRVTYPCNGVGVGNCNIQIWLWYWQTNANTQEFIVNKQPGDFSGRTDANGNYSFTTDIQYQGTFEYYTIIARGGTGGSAEYRNINPQSKDVQLDCSERNPSVVQFHIKDTMPSYTTDEFFYLTLLDNYDTIAKNLKGPSIDTTVFEAVAGVPNYLYKYSKNGQTTTTPRLYGVEGCFDTTKVDIYY